MSRLDWSNQDQVKAFEEWKDFMESYLFIMKIEKKDQWQYIRLSAGSQGKSIRDSWEMSNDEKEDPEKVFDKFSSHLVGTQNKWVMRLELTVEDFI